MSSEFRQDLVSGEWVLVAPTRSERPKEIKPRENNFQPIESCLFEDPEKTGQQVLEAYFIESNKNDWWIKVIQNKYPAVEIGNCGVMEKDGYFRKYPGRGMHEVIITRDHERNIPDFSNEEAEKLIEVFADRYKRMGSTKESCGNYILIFQNYGKEAGASIYHPHVQIISTPILPPSAARSINGAQRFFEENKIEAHKVMVSWEKEQGKRIIYENDDFVVFCPFVSKNPYEIKIFPKRFNPHFEEINESETKSLADVLIKVLSKIKSALNDSGYNLFIHSIPKIYDNETEHDFYCWHVEIVPSISIDAGFELGTGIDINMVDPDDAAEKLKI